MGGACETKRRPRGASRAALAPTFVSGQLFLGELRAPPWRGAISCRTHKAVARACHRRNWPETKVGASAARDAPRGRRSISQAPQIFRHALPPPELNRFCDRYPARKKLPKGVTTQKNTANHLAQGLQRIPTIHSQSTHTLSTGARLAKPPIPHYLVSRTQRTTTYRGSRKITHKSQPAKSSDFPG